MVLVDYSKGHGYSVLGECEDCGNLVSLKHNIKDFEKALTWARLIADDGSENVKETEEPVVKLSAVRAILQDFAEKTPANEKPV